MPGNKFAKMIGRTYLYGGENYVIKDVTHVEDDLFDVRTDKRSLRLSAGELKKDFLPVHVPAKRGNALAKLLENDSDMVNLSKVLSDSIKKLEKDATFIPQAQAINETAGKLIDLKKLQLDVIKTSRDLS